MMADDRAGDTSQGSGNAPARSFERQSVLESADLIARLETKGIRIDDDDVANELVSVIGYRHVARYVPALLAFPPIPRPSMSLEHPPPACPRRTDSFDIAVLLEPVDALGDAVAADADDSRELRLADVGVVAHRGEDARPVLAQAFPVAACVGLKLGWSRDA